MSCEMHVHVKYYVLTCNLCTKEATYIYIYIYREREREREREF